MSRRERALLIALFVALRALALAAGPLHVHKADELYTGLISHEINVGKAFPLFDYQLDVYGGGSLVLGVLGAPLFRLLGPRFLTLKLLALLWSAATFLVWLLVLERTLGRRGAAGAAIFWCFAPLVYLRLGLIAWGNHIESSLFTGLLLLLFFSARGLERPAGDVFPEVGDGAAPRRLALAGVVAGFSIYFCYSSLVGVAALGVLWLVVDRGRPWRRGLVPFVAGAVLGFSPWLAYNVTRRFAGLVLQGRGIGDHVVATPTSILRKAIRLVSYDLPLSFSPPPELGPHRFLLGAALLGAVLASALVAGRAVARAMRGRRRVSAAAVFLVYPAVYLVVYALVDFGAWPEEFGVYSYRFLAPLLPFLAALLGAGIAVERRIRSLVALPVALCLAALTASAAVESTTGLRVATWRGYSYRWFGLHLGAVQRPIEETLARAARIADPYDQRLCVAAFLRVALRERIGLARTTAPLSPGALDAERRFVATLAPPLDRLGREALDAELRFRVSRGEVTSLDWDDWVSGPLAGALDERPARTAAAAFALCRLGGPSLDEAIGRLPDLGHEERQSAVSAFGSCVGTSPPRVASDTLVEHLLPSDLPAFYRGLGEADDTGRLRVLPRWQRDFTCGRARKIAEYEADDPVCAEDLVARFLREAGVAPEDCPAARER